MPFVEYGIDFFSFSAVSIDLFSIGGILSLSQFLKGASCRLIIGFLVFFCF